MLLALVAIARTKDYTLLALTVNAKLDFSTILSHRSVLVVIINAPVVRLSQPNVLLALKQEQSIILQTPVPVIHTSMMLGHLRVYLAYITAKNV
jgi:hypothetical protein